MNTIPKKRIKDKNEAKRYLKKLFKTRYLEGEIKELYTPRRY
jgi:hypothetical protein